jgi:uncharacterized membrane protein YbhN (UPF0104 family)
MHEPEARPEADLFTYAEATPEDTRHAAPSRVLHRAMNGPTPRPPALPLRGLLVAVALGAAPMRGLAVAARWAATLEALLRFRWRLLPLILGAVLVNYALRFAKWEYYLRVLAIPLPRRQSLLVFLAGLTMAISPGKLGEVVKALLVRDLVGTEVSRTASVVMAERLTDVAGMLVLAALGATVLPGGAILFGAGAALLALAVIAMRHPGLAEAACRALPPGSRLARLGESLARFLVAGRTLLAPRPLGVALAVSVVSWLFECIALFLVLVGLGAPTGLRVATFVYAFASLAGALSMLPGGLGVTEGSLAGLLVAFGSPPGEAAAATLLIRATTLWLAVLVGVATLLFAFRKAPRISQPTAA